MVLTHNNVFLAGKFRLLAITNFTSPISDAIISMFLPPFSFFDEIDP